MERDLTTGSVFKTIVYFALPYSVWRGQQYDGGIDRKPDHAYADSYDRRACDGSDGYDRALHRCKRL